MSTFCLSAAVILRCESFSTLQNQALIVPTVLEVFFSICLLIIKWGHGRTHLLLFAEGFSFFLLSLLELLIHIVPAVRVMLGIFIALDIFIAATSFIPILFYTFFLQSFVHDDLIDTLPNRYQRLAKYILLLFIPVLLILNEIASFIGIDRQSNGTVVLIGFSTSSAETLWSFFTSLTLALLTSYQVLVFSIAFYRMLKSIIDLRRIDNSGSSNATFLLRGLGWIVGGLKLGAIETTVGFAMQGGFETAMIRRVLRFLSRAFIIIGVVKGLDSLEDLSIFPILSDHPTDLRHQISNPRYSTFKRIDTPPLDVETSPESYQPKFRASRRVTVESPQGKAPSLQMRFSVFDPPTFAPTSDNINASSLSVPPDMFPPMHSAPAVMSSEKHVSTPMMTQFSTPRSPPAALVYNGSQRRSSQMSYMTGPRDMHQSMDTLESFDIKEITSQFPALPVLPVTSTRESKARLPAEDVIPENEDYELNSPSTPRSETIHSSKPTSKARKGKPLLSTIITVPIHGMPGSYHSAPSSIDQTVPTSVTSDTWPASGLNPWSPVSPSPPPPDVLLSPPLRIVGSPASVVSFEEIKVAKLEDEVTFKTDSSSSLNEIPELPNLTKGLPGSANTGRLAPHGVYTARTWSMVSAYRQQRASTAHWDVLPEEEEEDHAYREDRRSQLRRTGGGEHGQVHPSLLNIAFGAPAGDAGTRNVLGGGVGVGQVAERSTPTPTPHARQHASMAIEGIGLLLSPRDPARRWLIPDEVMSNLDSQRSFFEVE